jgi:hypothetical protein
MAFEGNDKLLNPGEFVIEELLLTSYNGTIVDLRNHFVELVINESMDRASLSGFVVLADNLNFTRHIPLIGNEKLRIRFKTAGRAKAIAQEFHCFKVSNRQESPGNKNAAVYELHFVSSTHISSLKTKMSKSFYDMKFSEMAEKIYIDEMRGQKQLVVQPTHGKKNFVFPYQSPIEAIKRLAKLSLSTDLQDSAYVFYENIDYFFFCSFNYLAKQSTVAATYSWQQPGISGEPNSTVLRDLAQDFFRIENFKILSHNNTIQNVEHGLFGSSTVIVDTTFKTTDYQDFSYNNDYYKLNTMQQTGLLPRNGDNFSEHTMASYHVLPRQRFGYENMEQIEDYEATYLQRRAYMAQLANTRISIVVAGDSSRRVGEAVKVNIPSIEPNQKLSDLHDPYLSGVYIITQVTHIVQKNQYKMRLFLERDSQNTAFPEVKTTEYKL